jgi:hypothetical protein
MTKSGPYNDEQDTTRRRVCYRYGKLLQVEQGPQRDWGWSDSEDEDAPSPLTAAVELGGSEDKLYDRGEREGEGG